MENKTVIFAASKSNIDGHYANMHVCTLENVRGELQNIVAWSPFASFRWPKYAVMNDSSASEFKKVVSMAPDEFNEFFGDLNLSPKLISQFFNSKIANTYGVQGIANKSPRIPKRSLVVGQSYIVNDEEEWVYLGKVKQVSRNVTQTYYGYARVTEHTTAESIESHLNNNRNNRNTGIWNYKSLKRFIRKGSIKITVPKTLPNVGITFLDA